MDDISICLWAQHVWGNPGQPNLLCDFIFCDLMWKLWKVDYRDNISVDLWWVDVGGISYEKRKFEKCSDVENNHSFQQYCTSALKWSCYNGETGPFLHIPIILQHYTLSN